MFEGLKKVVFSHFIRYRTLINFNLAIDYVNNI